MRNILKPNTTTKHMTTKIIDTDADFDKIRHSV